MFLTGLGSTGFIEGLVSCFKGDVEAVFRDQDGSAMTINRYIPSTRCNLGAAAGEVAYSAVNTAITRFERTQSRPPAQRRGTSDSAALLDSLSITYCCQR